MSDLYTAAREYGRALFLLTEELGESDEVKLESEAVISLLTDNPEYARLLDTPALSPDERIALIDEAFGELNTNLLNLIKILAEKRLVHIASRTLTAYVDEYMEARGIVRAEAVSAVALDEKQTELLRLKLEKITGKQIIIENRIDPSILGGIKLRYMGIQRDGSVKTRLDGFARALTDTVI